MSKKLLIITSVILAVSFILSACGSATTAAPQTEIQTKVVVVTATPGPAGATPLPAGSVQITGAGATFPLPVYSQWTYAYQYVDPSVILNYNGVGSGAGKTAILNNTVVGLVARQGSTNLAEARREFAYQLERALAAPAA